MPLHDMDSLYNILDSIDDRLIAIIDLLQHITEMLAVLKGKGKEDVTQATANDV